MTRFSNAECYLDFVWEFNSMLSQGKFMAKKFPREICDVKKNRMTSPISQYYAIFNRDKYN